MVHVAALPGTPRNSMKMDAILSHRHKEMLHAENRKWTDQEKKPYLERLL